MTLRNETEWDSSDQPQCGREVLSDTFHALVDDDAIRTHVANEALPHAWIERLFAHMEALYGIRFKVLWRDVHMPQVVAHWAAELGRLTAGQLTRGIESLATSTASPTLPQFVRLCKPEIEPRAAYFEAVDGVIARERGEYGVWSDPAIYWASTAIGAFDLKTKPYAQIKSRWEAALSAEQAHPHAEPVPPPQMPQACPDQGKRSRSPNATRKIVAELHATLAQTKQDVRDHKRWARRIQSRLADGDQNITDLQEQVAREALK